jgi:N-acetyl-1-D-myo-inositol-2-amino-2-deoxy-alpha-D-glucopyranoside deacetylase
MGLLLVHAHPDDESIGTGGTMARYSAELAWASGRGAEGERVTLVTCTLGEMGEIIPPSLAHLTPDELGQHRIGELKAACDCLGVRDHRFLGGPGRWRDSGMMGTAANDDPRCLWRADVDEAAAALAEVIDEVAPRVIVTYDANGFYGHPDHIQAHRVAWRAYQLACDPARTSFYATAAPDSPAVTAKVDVTRYLPAKFAAMRAHATQITVSEPDFALSNGVWEHVPDVECYTLLAGPVGSETGLFPR